MNLADFGLKVHQSLDELTPELRRQILNVAIVVGEQADSKTRVLAGVDDPLDLLGFYHGISLTERTHDFGLVLPNKISIYHRSILRACKTDNEVRELTAQNRILDGLSLTGLCWAIVRGEI